MPSAIIAAAAATGLRADGAAGMTEVVCEVIPPHEPMSGARIFAMTDQIAEAPECRVPGFVGWDAVFHQPLGLERQVTFELLPNLGVPIAAQPASHDRASCS
jgi:hypothetical protein